MNTRPFIIRDLHQKVEEEKIPPGIFDYKVEEEKIPPGIFDYKVEEEKSRGLFELLPLSKTPSSPSRGSDEPLLHTNLFMLYKTMIQSGVTVCIKTN
jgi:hypothetical protein